jgi:hypothetical protein
MSDSTRRPRRRKVMGDRPSERALEAGEGNRRVRARLRRNTKLRCLSIAQPYANAILTGQKYEVYRTWRTRYRGLLAIHAGKPPMPDAGGPLPTASVPWCVVIPRDQ